MCLPVCSSLSSYVCSSVSCVSSLLESGNGMDTLCKVLIWGLPCKCFSRVSLKLMGNLSLRVLLLAEEFWLVVDCISSLGVASASVSSGLELVDFCDSLVGSLNSLDSLDSVGSRESGLDSGIFSAFCFSVSTEAAEWPFIAVR